MWRPRQLGARLVDVRLIRPRLEVRIVDPQFGADEDLAGGALSRPDVGNDCRAVHGVCQRAAQALVCHRTVGAFVVDVAVGAGRRAD